jgi:uncharacterized protein
MHRIIIWIAWLVKKPALVLTAILLLTTAFVLVIAENASLETDLEAYMPSTHPAFIFSDDAEELFGIEDSILIAISHPETIYNEETLKKIARISAELPERFEEIEAGSITSLHTADNITSSDWGLEVEPFYINAPSEEAELQELRKKVESNEMVYGRTVSTDGTAALILAELGEGTFSGTFYNELKAYAAELQGPETIYIAGQPVVEGELARLGPQDMMLMAPLVLVLMTIILLLLLRSIRDTIINLIIVLIGTAAAFGLMGLLQVPIYAVDTMIPVMLIAIGVAYGIHMHNAIHHLVREEPRITKQQLIEKTLQAMIRPVSMAAVTTAIGFTALITSQILPVRYFGLFAALGVIVEMILALILFPLVIQILGPPKKTHEKEDEYLDEVTEKDKQLMQRRPGRRILDHPITVGITAALITAAALAGSSKVWIDTSFLANFQKDSDIVRTDTFVNTYFGGTSALNVILTADENDRFKDPEVLTLLDTMQKKINKSPVVGGSFSLADFMRRMNSVMHEEQEGWNTVPESRELAAQYLLLYEMSGDPETLNRVIDYDYRTANLTFQLKSDSSAVMQTVIDDIETYSEEFAKMGITIQFAGGGYKALVFADLLMEGQIASLALSFVIVALLLTLLFRSFLIGIVGTIPIAVTAVVNFGTMGLLGIPLSSATALISSIAIGIGVDYAIHLIEHYRIRRLEGYTIQDAAHETLIHTGRAILYNAAAVMGGFAVLLFSVFPPNRQVGGLIALNMAVSAAGTLTVLILVIIAIDKRGRFLKITREQKTRE